MKKNIFIEFFKYSIGALLSLMLFSILLQIFVRDMLNFAFQWTEELARYAMIWIVFLGAIVSLKEGSHIVVNVLVERLSINYQKYINLIANLLIFIFLIFLFIKSVELSTSPSIMNQLTPGLKIPTYFVYSSLPIGAGAMIIVSIYLILKAIIRIMKTQ